MGTDGVDQHGPLSAAEPAILASGATSKRFAAPVS